MNYYDELYHYGVKGQKWGVRRFQNADGSLTAKGRKRYSNNTTSKSNAKVKSSTESKTKETIEQKKNRLIRSKSVKDLYDNTELFDNKELQEAVLRKTNEDTLRKLLPKEVSKFDQTMEWISNKGEKISNAAKNAKNAYENGKAFLEAIGIISKSGSTSKPNNKTDDDSNDKSNNKSNDTTESVDTEISDRTKSSSKNSNSSGASNGKTRDSAIDVDFVDKSNRDDDYGGYSPQQVLNTGRKVVAVIDTARSVAGLLGSGSSSVETGKRVAGLLPPGTNDINVSDISDDDD